MIMIGTSVQHFPRWFPGTHYVGVAEEWRPTVRELHDYPVRTVRAQRVRRSAVPTPTPALLIRGTPQESGDAKPCFVLSQLEEMDSWDSVS